MEIILMIISILSLAFIFYLLYSIKKDNHSQDCDVNPETLTWKRDIEKDGIAHICQDCYLKINKQ